MTNPPDFFHQGTQPEPAVDDQTRQPAPPPAGPPPRPQYGGPAPQPPHSVPAHQQTRPGASGYPPQPAPSGYPPQPAQSSGADFGDAGDNGDNGEFFCDRQPAETDRDTLTPPYGWQAQANPPQPAAGPQPGLQPIDSDDDRDIVVTRRRRPTAARGWRRTVAKMTGGRVNPAPSAKQEQADELVKRIRASLVGVHKVAFVCAKGGVGKTTMTVAVGNAIARERGDRVIAVDVNTDLGNLSARFSEDGGPQANIEYLSSLQNIGRYSNVRVHTVQNNDRLEMLGAQNDPRSSYTLGAQDYAATMKILETHYNVILLDCGTSITSPLFSTITNDVSSLVVVAALNAPGVKLAKQSLQWLNAHGFGRLLPRTVLVLNATDRGPALIDVDAAETMFRQLVPEVIRVPYDPHLAEGMAIEFTACKPRTRKGLMELAGALAAHYPARQRSYQMPRHRPSESGRV